MYTIFLKLFYKIQSMHDYACDNRFKKINWVETLVLYDMKYTYNVTIIILTIHTRH